MFIPKPLLKTSSMKESGHQVFGSGP